MKTKFYFLCISLIIVSCNSDLSVDTPYYLECLECLEMTRPVDSYNFPVYPGQEAWESFTSSNEMNDALQIPSSFLKNISTQAVIQSIWEHPLLRELFFLGNGQYQKDFEILFLNNNAYLELANRNDAGESLLYRYECVKPFALNSPCFESKLIELLISQPIFLSQLDMDAKIRIVEIAFNNDNEIQNNSKWSNIARPVTWLLIARTMFSADYAPFIETLNGNSELKNFLEGWLPPVESTDNDSEDDLLISNEPQGVIYMLYKYDDIIIKDIINYGKRFINK